MTSTRSVASIDSFEVISTIFLTHIEQCLSHNLTNVHHNLGGQLKSPWREIRRLGNVSCNKAVFARVVWHVVPSCWNHIFSNSYSSIAGRKKVDYHMAITLLIIGKRSEVLFINIPTVCEMCFIVDENFVRKIFAYRQLFKHPFYVSTTLGMVSWLQ